MINRMALGVDDTQNKVEETILNRRAGNEPGAISIGADGQPWRQARRIGCEHPGKWTLPPRRIIHGLKLDTITYVYGAIRNVLGCNLDEHLVLKLSNTQVIRVKHWGIRSAVK